MAVLFSISCPTCQRRLTVRSAAAIGQILNCPNCGGMVKVEPPADWEDPEAAQETVEEIEPPHQQEQTSAHPGRATTEVSGPEADAMDPPLDEAILPGETWESESVRNTRRKLVVGFLAVLALSCALLLGWRLAQRSSSHDRETASVDDLDAPSDARGAEKGGGAVKGGGAEEAGEDEPRAPNLPAKTGEGGDQRQPKEQPSGEQAEFNGHEEKKRSSDEPGQAADDASDPAATSPTAPTEGGRAGQDQAGRDAPVADSATPPGLKPGGGDEQAEVAVTTALEKLESMINPGDDASREQPRAENGAAAARAPLRRERNVAALLATKVERLSLLDVPLIELPQLVYGLTGVPVTLDVDSLTAAGVSLRTPLQGNFEAASIGEVMRQLLQPLPVQEEITKGGLRVSGTNAGPFAVRYRLDHLPGGESQVDELMRTIPRWFPSSTWERRPPPLELDGESLKVVQEAPMHGKLRALQAQYLWQRWNSMEPDSLFPAPLDHRLTFVVIEPTPLHLALQRLREVSGVDFVIDWESAAAVGCEPDVQVTLELYQQPLARVLARLLADSDLTFRVVDETTVAVRGIGGVEGFRVHRIPIAWGRGEELETRLGAWRREVDPTGEKGIFLDRSSGLLIVPGDARLQAQVTNFLAQPPKPPEEEKKS